MRALVQWAAGAGQVALRDVPEPVAGAGWVVVDVAASGVCGTDLHLLHGTHRSRPPVVLGHEYAGRIRSLGEGVQDWRVGQRVVCEQHTLACGTCFSCRTGALHLCPAKWSPGWGIDGAFAAQVTLPAALLHAVPDGVPTLRAVVTEPTAICLTALDRVAVRAGETVVVVGPGPVGVLCAMLARLAGAGRVLLVGRSSSAARLRAAVAQGVEVLTADADDVPGAVLAVTARRGADVVLEASGSPTGFDTAVSLTRRAGRVALLGIVGASVTAVDLDAATYRSLTVHFCLSSEYSTWDRALALMGTGGFRPEELTSLYPLEEWERAFDDVQARRVVKAVITPNGTAALGETT